VLRFDYHQLSEACGIHELIGYAARSSKLAWASCPPHYSIRKSINATSSFLRQCSRPSFPVLRIHTALAVSAIIQRFCTGSQSSITSTRAADDHNCCCSLPGTTPGYSASAKSVGSPSWEGWFYFDRCVCFSLGNAEPWPHNWPGPGLYMFMRAMGLRGVRGCRE
jgi:hypothetical protein